MPPLLTTAATIMCPHGGTVRAQSVAPATAGTAVLRTGDTYTVAGCPFSTPATGPHPCVTVAWSAPAAAVTVDGDPPLTTASLGLCKAVDQAVQGAATVAPGQVRAAAR